MSSIEKNAKDGVDFSSAFKHLLDGYTEQKPFTCFIPVDGIDWYEPGKTPFIVSIWLQKDGTVVFRLDDGNIIFYFNGESDNLEQSLNSDTLRNVLDALNKELPLPSQCPYCGSVNFEYLGDDMYGERQWHCHECNSFFSPQDTVREPIRRQISLILTDSDENHQVDCFIAIGESEACGLSSLELPRIVKAYQVPGEGTIWFRVYGLVNDNDGYVNFDDLDTTDLKTILEELQNQRNGN